MKYYLAIILSCIVWAGFGQIDTSKQVAEKITYDNLWVSKGDKKVCIKVIVDRIRNKKRAWTDMNELVDRSISVYDENDQLIYIKNYATPDDAFEFTITPSSLYLEGVGYVLIVNEFSLPSLGWDGDVTVYGFDDYGYLLPLTYPISLTKKFSDGTYLKVKEVDEKQKQWNTRNHCKSCNLAIETTNDLGWCEFNFLRYYPLNLDGIGPLGDVEEYQPQKIPLDVRPSAQKEIKEFSDFEDNRNITLYEKPDRSSSSKLVHLQIGSNVEFYHMEIKEGTHFVYLAIDGSVGYSPIWTDYSLNKLGFYQCN